MAQKTPNEKDAVAIYIYRNDKNLINKIFAARLINDKKTKTSAFIHELLNYAIESGYLKNEMKIVRQLTGQSNVENTTDVDSDEFSSFNNFNFPTESLGDDEEETLNAKDIEEPIN